MITIKDFAYTVPAAVSAGSRLMVQNKDSTAHTVTLAGGASGKVIVQAGASATLTAPARAGRYPITCDFHGNMQATLVVS